MNLSVRIGDPLSPEGRALLAESQAYMSSIYSDDENFALSTEALAGPGILFLIAETDGKATGCAALVVKEGYGEIKSMYVDPVTRGAGAGAALINALLAHAEQADLQKLRLETGPELDAAVRLYERNGFVRIGPFGDYPDAPGSIFMERQVS